MKKFEILRYLKRFSLLIFLVSLAGAAAIYLYADGRQKYTASVIIRYTNDGISDGYTPDGSELDVNEIYSSTVIWFPWNLEIGDWSAIGEETLIYNLGKVTIGEKATVSHRVHVCAGTHDYTDPALPLLRPEIRIGNQTWICANTFIGPDIEIGEGAVIGAGTVMVKDAEPWGVYAGNPAKYIKKRILKH